MIYINIFGAVFKHDSAVLHNYWEWFMYLT